MEQIRCEQGSLCRVRRFRKLVVNNRLLVASFKRQDLFFGQYARRASLTRATLGLPVKKSSQTF